MTPNSYVNSNKIWGVLARYGLPLLAVFVLISLVRNMSLLILARQRLTEAQTHLEDQKKTVEATKEQLERVENTQYQETVIRDKLGLAKEGEYVFVLPDDETLKNLSPRVERKKEYQLPDPNWKKWLKLFI